jgi:hypothetical protein
MKTIRVPLLGTAAVVLTLAAVTAAGAGVATETRDVVGQGMGGPVVSPNGATIQRSDSGISAKLSMPTPVPGSYVYPTTSPPDVGFPPAEEGHPEAYSLWMFVFYEPSECAGDPCTITDFNALFPQGKAGAFNAGGHIVGGPNLQLSGRVTLSTTPFRGTTLRNPLGSEVHLAVAPHGKLDPALLPEMINLPIGTPAQWWFAIFEIEE